jgi:hypothetical protein
MGTGYGSEIEYYGDYEEYFNRRAYWTYEFAWIPHKCELSGQTIWLKYAYKGECRIGDYMDPVDTRWRTNKAHIWKLIQQ